MTDEKRRRALERIGAEMPDVTEIGYAALVLAACDRQSANLDPYVAHLEMLAADLAAGAGRCRTAVAQADWLSEVLLSKHGYSGDQDDYDDPQNADLMRVIDRRRGLPVALAVLFLHAGQKTGWDVAGVNFPNHFLLRVQADGGRVIFDPFHDGRILTTVGLQQLLSQMTGGDELQAEHTADVTNRQVLLRLQNNIKIRALQVGEAERATEILERMILLAPQELGLLQEAAQTYFAAGEIQAAIATTERFISLTDDLAARHQSLMLLEGLRRRLN